MANDTKQEKWETICLGRHNYDASPKVRERVKDTKHWTRETLFLGRQNYDVLIIILYNTDIVSSIVKLIVHSPVGKLA